MRWDGPAPLQSGNAELQGKLYLQTIATFRCKTQTIDSVFIRGGDVGTRPNAPISLTIGAVIRDREGAARIRSARYAAHAVSLLGGTMVRRAYRQRSLVEVLLPDGDKLWDSTLRQIDTLLDDDVLIDRVAEALARRHVAIVCDAVSGLAVVDFDPRNSDGTARAVPRQEFCCLR